MSAALAILACLAALAALALAAAIARPGRRSGARSRTRSPTPARATPLVDTERLLADSRDHMGTVEGRLAPTVAAIAAGRLRARGIDLEGEPDRAREAVSPGLFALIDPGRSPVEDRRAPGLETDELEALIGELERL